MTRVSSFGQTQFLIETMIRNQGRVFEDQKEITTGKKSQDFAGLGIDSVTSLGARAFQERIETYQRTISVVEGRLGANNLQLDSILGTAGNLRQEILTMVAQDEGAAFAALLEDSFSSIASALNTRIGAQFIFSGSQSDVAAASSTDIADLVAAPLAIDILLDENAAAFAVVSESVELEFGILAREVGTELFESLKRLAEFDAGVDGPIDGKLTAVQRTFLVGELKLLDQAIDSVQKIQVKNGLNQRRIETIDSQHGETSDFLIEFISDVEDVNVAEAISNLNRDQAALEASYRTFGTLANINLLRFI